VATSIVVSSLMRDGTPTLHGYVLAFATSAAALLIAAVTTLLIPRHRKADHPGDADHAGLTTASGRAEAGASVGAPHLTVLEV
jgi:hypothetical protein